MALLLITTVRVPPDCAHSLLLFKFRASDFASVDQQSDGQVLLRVQANSKKGEKAELDLGSVDKLVKFEGTNRYGKRDEQFGGDDWAQPGVAQFVKGITGASWDDFSHMNGGVFPDHQTHDEGRDADGWFEGYNNRNAAVASQLIDLLNGITNLGRIQVVYVTYSARSGNAFYDAINGKTLKNGRRAKDLIRPLGKHDGHFHIMVR